MSENIVDTKDVDTKIKEILAEVLEIEVARLEESGRLYEDYGADSLTTLEILSRIESELGIEVPETEASRIVSLSSLRRIISEHRNLPNDSDA